MANWSGKRIKAFGLDISDGSIKAVQLTSNRGQIVPLAFGEIDLNSKVINNHNIVDENRLAEYIRRAILSAGKIDTQYAVCSILEAKSFVRTLTIPKMPEDEINGAIPYELEQDIPIAIDQVYMDWQ